LLRLSGVGVVDAIGTGKLAMVLIPNCCGEVDSAENELAERGEVLSVSVPVVEDLLAVLNWIVRSTLPPLADFFFFRPNFLLSFLMLGDRASVTP
jgi:hypothetical protein